MIVPKRAGIIAAGVLSVPSLCGAHGVVGYISTPMTPPIEFIWLPVLFGAASVAWDLWVAKAENLPGDAAGASLGSLVVYAVIFLGIGLVVSYPAPSVGLPHRAFFGMKLRECWLGFLIGNGIGLLLFIVVKRGLCRRLGLHRTHAGRLLVLGNVVIYFLGLIPYFIFGGFAHGWGGGYVSTNCRMNVETIGIAVALYADSNEGRLPDVQNIEQLVDAVHDHIPQRTRWSDRPLDVCPFEAMYKRNPARYVWDASFAGALLNEQTAQERTSPVLRCETPHDVGKSSAIDLHRLLELQATWKSGPAEFHPDE